MVAGVAAGCGWGAGGCGAYRDRPWRLPAAPWGIVEVLAQTKEVLTVARRLLTKQDIRQAIWDHIPDAPTPAVERLTTMIYAETLEAFFEGQGDSNE